MALPLVSLQEDLKELRETFRRGKTRSLGWRKAQLRSLLRLLSEQEDQIFAVLREDLGKHQAEAYRDEIGVLEKSLRYSLSHIKKWMAPKKRQLPLAFFPARAQVLPEPLGLILIFSAWNFPLALSLEPLIGAISAGCVAVIKPSEHAPATSSFLATAIPKYMDNKTIKVIEGGAPVAEQLLQEKWDKIFFTGSNQIGRIVMSAAAKHLTPVTLELGGKCPVVLDSQLSSSDTEMAIKRIVSAKWGCCIGQACLAIDYVLVEEKLASTLIDLLKKYIKRTYGENPAESKITAKIVNKHHFNRLRNLLEEPGVSASVVHGGSVDEEKLFIQPTILLDPPLTSQLMTQEIFGPLLPIVTLKNIQDSIEFISSRPKPLAIYVFTKDELLKRRILSETSSGSVTFNDVLVQYLADELPFGGVGGSGIGSYHGKFSFDTFSHEKAVLRRSFFFEPGARYPPWNDFKLKFIRLLYSFDYFGVVLLLLGLKK
ncbi:aldehyde dehydrogenase family 3 member F1-like [Macadamia integrifolia]|uniref:aldehyde dehydrogenase family 3 member F1-like n=1 Tax=Macadamia integrifolia TaxID=60698 RepID=UPI001C4FD1B2|nr:aldehyde dehydrogenase family 3 member F1-like [Macadamia integrifolia]